MGGGTKGLGEYSGTRRHTGVQGDKGDKGGYRGQGLKHGEKSDRLTHNIPLQVFLLIVDRIRNINISKPTRLERLLCTYVTHAVELE